MEYLNKQYCQILLISLCIIFFAYGYSTPLDTIKKSNCPNGFSIQINGKYQCIDNSILYYPFPKYWNDLYQNYYHDKMKSLTWKQLISEELGELSIHYYYNRMKSLNLQLLEEPKWYNEDMQEDRLRIFFIEYSPSFDSIVLFSFFMQDQNFIKLIKKEMPVYYYYEPFLPDSSYFLIDSIYVWPEYGYVLPDSSSYSDSSSYYIKEHSVVNYKQTEFVIHKRKIQSLIKQLHKLKNCETFDRYGYDSGFVIEYFLRGEYFLLVAETPEWYDGQPEFLEVDRRCPRKSGLKIMKWLKNWF